MVRRSLFWGLTLMLTAAFVYLIIQGRREEKKLQQSAARQIEFVRESKPTLIRILSPQDLEIVEAKMELSRAGDKSPGGRLSAKHHIVIRNNGPLTYRNPRLRLFYLGRGEKTLETRPVELEEILLPGQARAMKEIAVENIPGGILRSDIRILSADLESGAEKPQ